MSDDEIEQFSDASRAALRQRTDALIEGLREYADAVLDMRGGAAELDRLLARNTVVDELVHAWDDAVFDHTGTIALLLDDEVEPEDFEDEEEELPQTGVLSIVSRVDVAIDDPDELLTAGRAAYRRLWDEESDEDARAAVDDVVQAIYTVAHEAGEQFLEIPGTTMVQAVRAYVAVEPPYEVADDLDADVLDQVGVPDGTLVFSEAWV